MNTTYNFNLPAVAGVLFRRWKFILILTVIAAMAGLAGSFLRPATYVARATFFLKNPFYADRNFIYNSDAKYIDYFAGDDDIKHLFVLLQSDSMQSVLIRELNLLDAYHIDQRDSVAVLKFREKMRLSFNLWRTENKDVEVDYTDKDPKRAAAGANLSVQLLEQHLQGFYSGVRQSMHASVLRKIQEEGQIIATLTDSLVQLRKLYGIYDIISPARNNLMLSSVNSNGTGDKARGVEEIQNIESMKDEMVTVRAHNLSLAEQYATGTAPQEMPLIYSLKQSLPPVQAEGPGKLIVAAIAAVCGFVFACLLVLLTSRYQASQSSSAD